jgi:hypothetical protein
MTATVTTVFRIATGGLGAYERYESNRKSAARRGMTTTCSHCGKGMAEGTGWIAAFEPRTECLVPLGTTGPNTVEEVLLGNECVKHWSTGLDADTKAAMFRRASA